MAGAYAACTWATVLSNRDDYTQALKLIEGALPLVAGSRDYAEDQTSCRIAESVAAAQVRDARRAIAAGERALALEEQRGSAPGRSYYPLSVLAMAYVRGERYADAERTFTRALALLDSQGLENDRMAQTLLNNWQPDAPDDRADAGFGRQIAAGD